LARYANLEVKGEELEEIQEAVDEDTLEVETENPKNLLNED
jgi:hypothetical protein